MSTPRTSPETLSETELPGQGTKGTEGTHEDWKAKYEAAEAARAKLDSDLKAQRGLRLSAEELDNRIITHIDDRIGLLEKQTGALIHAIGTGATDDLPEQAARISAEEDNTRAARRFETQYRMRTISTVVRSFPSGTGSD